jgi:hypothetical protein
VRPGERAGVPLFHISAEDQPAQPRAGTTIVPTARSIRRGAAFH